MKDESRITGRGFQGVQTILQYFRKLSIRAKLALFTVVASGAAILVACGGFAAYDILSARRAVLETCETQAAIIAGNCTASLSFGDTTDATNTLSSLKSDGRVEPAAVYTSDLKLMAGYTREAGF